MDLTVYSEKTKKLYDSLAHITEALLFVDAPDKELDNVKVKLHRIRSKVVGSEWEPERIKEQLKLIRSILFFERSKQRYSEQDKRVLASAIARTDETINVLKRD